MRFLHTDEGLVVFLTLALDPAESLADGARDGVAGRGADLGCVVPGVAEVIVHTEPLSRGARSRLNRPAMRLCMFHPNDNPLERGWVGRIDGDRVLHLAAQTLQSFFLGGGGAREHAEYALADVTLLVPVQYPPTVRLFDAQERRSLRERDRRGRARSDRAVAGAAPLAATRAIAAVIGAGGEIGGYYGAARVARPAGEAAPKDRDFALVLGPVVVTPDELAPDAVGFVVPLSAGGGAATARRAPRSTGRRRSRSPRAGTTLRPGDVIAGPPASVARRARPAASSSRSRASASLRQVVA